MQRTSIPSGKAALAVWHAGSGLPLLFLHSGVTDSRAWQGQLEPLADSHHVIAFDGRGFGETVYEPEPYSRVADALAVMDALQVGQAVLVGNSQGGCTALDFALAHPERVRALVLVGTAISGSPKVEQWPQDVKRIDDLMEQANAAGDLDTLNELEAWVWLDGPAGRGRVSGPIRELFLDMNGIALRAENPGEEIPPAQPTWPRLHEISVPTLVVVGDLDLPHIQANSAHLARTSSHAQLHVMPSAGHLPALEQPGAFNAVLDEFLRSLT